MNVIDFKSRCYMTYEKIMSVISSLETREQYGSCLKWINAVYKNLSKEIPSGSDYFDIIELITSMEEILTNKCMDMLDKINNKNMKTNTIICAKRQNKDAERTQLQYYKKLLKDAKKILQGKYAIIPYSGSSFMLYHIEYVDELTRWGYKNVDLAGESILFRKDNPVDCYEYIYDGNDMHGIGKQILEASIVVDKEFWNKIAYYLSEGFHDVEKINLAYNEIREYYEEITGKSIENATREAIESESLVSE